MSGGNPDVNITNIPHVIVDSIPAGSSGLTDNELRASAVPVSVSNIPHVIIDSMPAGGSGLTNTELRATPVPVSGTFFQVTQPVSGTFWQVTQPVSGTFWQATQPVSLATAPSTPVTGTFWQATQPVSGTFFQATQPVSNAGTFAVQAAQSGTWTVQPGNTANTTAWKVDASSVAVPITDNAGSLTVDNGGTFAVQATQAGTWTVQPGNTANTTAWKVDGSAVTQPVSIAATVGIQGAKTNNNAAPGATNVGVLDVVANASVQAWTEGNLVSASADLGGAIRTVPRPMVQLGSYRMAAMTGVYTGLSAGAILYSFRWADATKLCLVTRVNVRVNTTTAATVAGMIDRDLVIVRSFTAADTGGATISAAGSNQKMRTSQATMVAGLILIATTSALGAGTGTPDGNAIGLMGKQGTATEGVGLTLPPEDLFIYNVDQNYPITLATNEGFRVRIPTAMPTTIAQRTAVLVEWTEVAAAGSY